MEMFKTEVSYFFQPRIVVCDKQCNKAWGINGRPRYFLSDPEEDPDDYAFKADEELGEAPEDTGHYEGGDGKPMYPLEHNRWCVRECERSVLVEPQDVDGVVLPDFSKLVLNKPGKES